ncbi:MAG TPA: low molecular weight protein-tyrosine-phosphatase [Oleiagrimonas sp.]|nr:low molecular weight protein-tyrosine-phosphatase [Oleiagrimonas sp.]
MFQRILVVCVGNICRSPTAEILFRHHLPNIHISSAGINALVGRPMDATAQALLAEHHLDGSQHVARQLDEGMIRDADLILAMERTHIDSIVRRAPHAMGRTVLLGKWLEQREIADPYQQQRPAFEHVYQLIDTAVHAWKPYLQSRV